MQITHARDGGFASKATHSRADTGQVSVLSCYSMDYGLVCWKFLSPQAA